SVKSVSVSTTASRTVRAYPAGRSPVGGFVNGTPERRTASAEEYFSVAAPHYRAADGPAAQRYRLDHGPWRPLSATGVFYTGKLRTGRHRVAVRPAGQAGATTARFTWRGVGRPAPLRFQPAPGRRGWDAQPR